MNHCIYASVLIAGKETVNPLKKAIYAMAKTTALILMTATFVFVVADSAQAQNRFADGMKRLDRDNNGSLEPSEIPEFFRKSIFRLAEKANLDVRQPLPLSKLLPLAGGSVDSKDSQDGRFKSSSKDESAVPGFGEESDIPPPPAFDVPADSPLASTKPLDERYDEKVLRYVDDMLRRYDSNKSGILESEEWKNARWRTPPEESDLNKDGRLTKAELCERIAKRWGGYKKSSSSSSGGSSYTSTRSGSSSSSDTSDKVRRYAEGLIKQYDKNKNGVLDRDEWDRLRDRYGKADTNRDGALTLSEVTVHISNYSKSRSSSSSSSSSSSRSSYYRSSSSKDDKDKDSSSSRSRWSWRRSSDDKDKKDDDPKTYRFKSPVERLPKGLPSWWERADEDQDGQVKMSEFTSSWTYEKVEEFKQYDTNLDGVITPSEYFDWKAKQRR